MSNRYFSHVPIKGHSARVAGAEAHHLIHVMRAKAGDHVVLFDGSDAEWTGRVEEVTRTEVRLSLLERREVNRELPVELTLGVALPKGDRQKWLVEKAVELGVGQLVPLITARTVAQPGANTASRLSRAVIEASKQCGRNRLIKISKPKEWPRFVKENDPGQLRLLAHPCAESQAPDSTVCHKLHGAVVAVGPEGGFTPEEVGLAIDRGFRPIHLGPRTLRTETAAILLIAMVTQWVE
jgi:16S rRNA (uracil1498-N3)-methyltransferase